MKSSVQTLAKALQGPYREEHLFALQQALELYDTYQAQIQACEGAIERQLQQIEARVDSDRPPLGKPARRTHGEKLGFDLRIHLYRMGVIDRARRFTLPLPRVLYRVYRGGGRAVRSRA